MRYAEVNRKSHFQRFYCETCGDKKHLDPQGMDRDEIKRHLRKVHKIEAFTGTRRLVMATDGDDYLNTYELRIGRVKLTMITSGPRNAA